MPTDIVPVDTAINQLTDRPVEASEGETSPEADLEEATAVPSTPTSPRAATQTSR